MCLSNNQSTEAAPGCRRFRAWSAAVSIFVESLITCFGKSITTNNFLQNALHLKQFPY